MTSYLIINLILSCGALTVNHWMKIPHRVRFYLLMVAVIAWLLPLGLLTVELSQQTIQQIPIQTIQTLAVQTISAAPSPSNFNWIVLFSGLILLGLLRFGMDIAASAKLINSLKTNSQSHKDNKNIHFVSGINGAFVSGYFKPIIWIDINLKQSETLSTVITHEQQHIQNHDQFWLFIITLVQRLFWFNPLSLMLCHQCKKSIELSCDEACKTQLGQQQYQTHLAQLVINQQQKNHALMNNQIHQNQGFNIHRIEQLEQENTMTKFKTTQLSLIVLSALFLSTYSLITVADSSAIPELADDQVLLELKMRLNNEEAEEIKLITRNGKMANVTYGNHDFGFTSQVMPNKPSQIHTEILISKIENGQKTEVANPVIMTIDAEWAGLKFTEDEQSFDLKIMAQTSHGKKSIPVPPKPIAAPTAPSAPSAPNVAPSHPEMIATPKSAPVPIQASEPIPAPPPAPERKINK